MGDCIGDVPLVAGTFLRIPKGTLHQPHDIEADFRSPRHLVSCTRLIDYIKTVIRTGAFFSPGIDISRQSDQYEE